MRRLLLVLLIGCGSRNELVVEEARDGGPARCPSSRLDSSRCARGLTTCTYVDLATACGNTTCDCTRPLNECGTTPGCTPGTDHRAWCRAGASCAPGEGCVIESCDRNCVCVNGRYDCVPDRCG